MMKTIIVATDFSPVSVNAANYAVNMARALSVRVLLFNAYMVPITIGDVPLVLVSVDDLKEGSEKQLADLKNKLESTFPGYAKIEYEAKLGNIVDELENLCEKIKPFAVVMGTKGKTGMEKSVFGSTTLSAIRHLSSPVLAVPPVKEYGHGIRKIGFACDFKHVATTTPVIPIKEMVNEFSAELHILNVDYKDRHYKSDTPEEMYYLYKVFEDMKPQYHFIDHPDVEDGILEFGQANNLDLIITIPKKHRLLDGIFKPSSTKQLVFQTFIPLMSIHE